MKNVSIAKRGSKDAKCYMKKKQKTIITNDNT